MNKQLADDLRRLADAVETLPELRISADVHIFGVSTLEHIRAASRLMQKPRATHSSSGESQWIEGAFGPQVSVTAFYPKGLLGERVVVTEADLSLLEPANA